MDGSFRSRSNDRNGSFDGTTGTVLLAMQLNPQFFCFGRRNTALYFSLLILYFPFALPYDMHVPNDRYKQND